MDRKKCCFLSYTHPRTNNAGSKPMADAEIIMAEAGLRNIGVAQLWMRSAKLSIHFNRLVARFASTFRMPRNGAIVLQYPFQDGIATLYNSARLRGNKVILLIHDIDLLRGGDEDNLGILGGADVIIAHTPRMAQWIKGRFPGKKTVTLGVFDYLSAPPASHPEDPAADRPVRVVFAGNLAKAPFLAKLKAPKGMEIDVYGNAVPEIASWDKSVAYKGSLPPEELQKLLPDYDFGLVWDGDSLDCCSGPKGEYLRYNSPFKIASYLAAGLPAIYWKEMGLDGELRARGLGIGLNSLTDLDAVVRLPKSDRRRIAESVGNAATAIRSGQGLKAALDKALAMLDD